MPDPLAQPVPPEPAAAPPRKRGAAWLAWVVILLVVGFEVFGVPLMQRLRPGAGAAIAAKDRVDLLLTELQVRYIIGASQLTGGGQALYVQAQRSLNTGPIDQRLPFIVLAGDLDGPDEALDQITKIKAESAAQHIEPDPDQRAILDALTRLYRDRKDGTATLADADRDLLRRQLGWTGELALTPPDTADKEARARVVRPAKRLATTLIAVFVAAAGLGVLGLVWLVVWSVFFFLGKTRRGLPPPTNHGGVYAEAFAVYMVVFLALGIGYRLMHVPGPELLLAAAGMLLSLAAGLVWPVLRGVPWRQVRQELGLTLGRRPWLEPIIGLGGYALVLPIFAIGIIVSSLLIQYERHMKVGDRPEQYFAPVDQPSHPIIEWLQNPDWALLAQVVLVVLVASVLAPLVEETMFRGALYRHLRNATERRMGRAGSFLVSAVVVSFIFAVIHPQGVLAVPALMALAFGLTILREWRGSLLPSMMVHGIHNGLTTFVLVQALRS
jgi:membrane protease YdiL (CAAX protease family)